MSEEDSPNHGSPDGLRFEKGEHGVQVEASEGTVVAVQHMWHDTLEWSGAHPFLTCAVLVFLLVWLGIARAAGVATTRMKLEYEARRKEVEAQVREQPLPLPPPPKRGREQA